MDHPPLILIADDEAEFREILSAKLMDKGYWVAEAKDGNEAVAKARALHPACILMDINMPNENGTEAVLDIKQDPELKNVPIAFFTNMKDPWPGLKRDHPKTAQALGASEFIEKSRDIDDVCAVIKRLIQARAPSGGPARKA